MLAELHWVDSPDYGGRPEDRRGLRVNDVDPAPLARLIAAQLGIIDGNFAEAAQAIADDEHDGPIHLAHLVAACEYAAAETGGSMSFITRGQSGDPFSDLVKALREGGLASATAAAKGIDPYDRVRVLDILLRYLLAPITALIIDLRDDMIQPTTPPGDHRR